MTISQYNTTLIQHYQYNDDKFIQINSLSRIWTWDLSICLYLNLKHGDLDHLTTMTGLNQSCLSINYFLGFDIFLWRAYLKVKVLWLVAILCLSWHNKRAPIEQWEWKGLCENKEICLAPEYRLSRGAICSSFNSLFNLCNWNMIVSTE